MTPTDPEVLPRTVKAFEVGRREGLHQGGLFYVSRQGQVIADFALGEARPGRGMEATTPILWLSACKPFAAVAIAQLWEDGSLDLDDPIALHVPEFAERGKDKITLRHALTHTGGFRLLNLGWPHATWEEVIEKICQARPEPRWVLGQTAGYHLASSWFILGEVVRRRSGHPFEEYVREKIFEPLGMTRSWIGMPEEEFDRIGEEIAVMENTESRTAVAFPWHQRPYLTRCNPGANGCGPMRDLARLYEMFLRRGTTPSGERFLRPQTVEALSCPHRVGLFDKTFRAYLDWGLGLIINSRHYVASQTDKSGAEGRSTVPHDEPIVPYDEPIVPYGYGRYASRRTFGHSGRRSSTAFADPEHGLAVAFAVNGIPAAQHHEERTRALVEGIYHDLGLAPSG